MLTKVSAKKRRSIETTKYFKIWELVSQKANSPMWLIESVFGLKWWYKADCAPGFYSLQAISLCCSQICFKIYVGSFDTAEIKCDDCYKITPYKADVLYNVDIKNGFVEQFSAPAYQFTTLDLELTAISLHTSIEKLNKSRPEVNFNPHRSEGRWFSHKILMNLLKLAKTIGLLSLRKNMPTVLYSITCFNLFKYTI